MKKISLIINPIAGGRDNKRFASQLALMLRKYNWKVEQHITSEEGHAHQIATAMRKNRSTLIASVGGDGTFNEIASALTESKAPLALIPCGSGNGLAHMVGISGLPRRILTYLDKGSFSQIDVGTVNEHNFFCSCGFGFDALVAHSFAKSRKRGIKSYIESTVQKAINYEGVNAEFTLDGKLFKGEFMLVTIANANQYGNNAFIAPNAKVDDGWLDVTIVRKFPKVLAGAVALSLFAKQIHQFKFVETYRVKEVEILYVSSPMFHRDGEHYNIDFPTKISIKPAALNLLLPPPNMLAQAEERLKRLDLTQLLKP